MQKGVELHDMSMLSIVMSLFDTKQNLTPRKARFCVLQTQQENKPHYQKPVIYKIKQRTQYNHNNP